VPHKIQAHEPQALPFARGGLGRGILERESRLAASDNVSGRTFLGYCAPPRLELCSLLRTLWSMEHGERFNTYTHLIGTLLALAGSAVLIVLGALRGDAWRIVSFSIYGATLVLMYALSSLYHNASRGKAKKILRTLDHNSIYLLIAGTYTPFALVSLRGS
jgi:predicted membrane channel-forming protein YqfA (hemolysin III family)